MGLNFRVDTNFDDGRLDCVGSKTEVACCNLFMEQNGWSKMTSDGKVIDYNNIRRYFDDRN